MIGIIAVPIVFLIYNYVIYPLFFNPLIRQGIPGPLHYKLSSFFILNDSRLEKRNALLQKLHLKYGPVVMIGPNEVSLNTVELMKKVYLGNYPKEFEKKGKTVHGFYSQFGNFGQRNMFSTGDSKTHILRKRPLQKIYSKSSILGAQEFIKAKVSNVTNKIDQLGPDVNVDVYSLFISMAMDVVSGFEYGTKFATDFVEKLPHTSKTLEVEGSIFNSFRNSSSMWFYTTLLPSLWTPVARWCGIEESVGYAQDWIYAKFCDAMDALVSGDDASDPDYPVPNVISTMWDGLRDKSKQIVQGTLPPNRNRGHSYQVEGIPSSQINSIASEIADHVAAGHETTGITLAYITWELSRPANAHWQQKLRQEVAGIDDLSELDKLPILHAIVQEALRLHAAIPGSEPRFVPPGKSLDVTVAGRSKIIPEGTMVSCQPFSLHLLPVFGSDVYKFRPERWLQDENETPEQHNQRIHRMNGSMFVFGQGNRMCLGMHLAQCEMKMCLAEIYSKFKTKVSPDWCSKVVQDNSDVKTGYSELPMRYKSSGYQELTDVDKMAMADTYTTRPMFDECWLQFDRW